jgi:TM2 domain-containing membrane protein YozV
MRTPGVAYLLWLLIFLGFGGIHRIYAGKIITGLIWLFTGGLFLIGQVIDLFLIPSMIERANRES